ncbi:hypothetical protein BGZ83_006654 [Gryganskiella cystojenkinii]|nr:hypothetical protein BGZ83_006654 [Gryganskiella cystojenkinii]
MSHSLLAAAGRLRSVVLSKTTTAPPACRRGMLLLSTRSNHTLNRIPTSSASTSLSHQSQRQQQRSTFTTTTPSKTFQPVGAAVSVTASATPSSTDSEDGYDSDDLNFDSDTDSEAESDSSLPLSERQKKDVADSKRYQRPKFTREIDEQIVQLRESGASWSMIASKLLMPPRSCHRRYMSLLDPALKIFWTQERIDRLDDMVGQGMTWKEIGKEFNVLSTTCRLKWQSLVRPASNARNRQFDQVQSKVLVDLVKEHGEDDWKLILRGFMMQLGAKDMAKVTSDQLRHQYYRLKRKPTHVWTLDDEMILIQHVLKHGTTQWEQVSEALGSDRHTAEHCKDKWLSLDMKTHNPKDRLWYKAERGNFWRLWLKMGPDWNGISKSLSKRTPGQVQDFFERATAKFDHNNPEKFKQQVEALAKEMSSYNTHVWKEEDSERLWQVADQCRGKAGRVVWTKVAAIMDMGITRNQYKHHHYYLKMAKGGQGLGGTWAEEEIRKLEKAVREVGRDWKLIHELYMPHRNPKSLCHKFQMIRNRGQHISPEDYDMLMSTVDVQEEVHNRRFGSTDVPFTPNWSQIAATMPGEGWSAEQCRVAYENSFKSRIRVQWTEQEDELLLQSAKDLGRKNWIGIAGRFTGKDTWQCRLRWSELQEPVIKPPNTNKDQSSTNGDDSSGHNNSQGEGGEVRS